MQPPIIIDIAHDQDIQRHKRASSGIELSFVVGVSWTRLPDRLGLVGDGRADDSWHVHLGSLPVGWQCTDCNRWHCVLVVGAV